MRGWVLGGMLLLLALPAAGATRPGPAVVSPGSARDLVLVESRCPTFSWGSVAGAREYDLVVYRLDDEGEPLAAHLRRSFDGAVTSWTPALEHCFDRGGRYAWTIRASTDDGDTDWSPASLFAVAAPHHDLTPQEALGRLQELLAAASGEAYAAGPAAGHEVASEAPTGPSTDSSPAEAPTIGSPVGQAPLTVAGEVRALGPDGNPRLWGVGGPNTMRYGTADSGLCEQSGLLFGLSQTMVPWYAAQNACPVGTWVCQPADRGSTVCDTERPDDTIDGHLCDGSWVDWDADNHIGWVDTASGEYSAHIRREQGNSGVHSICSSYPVWCCSE